MRVRVPLFTSHTYCHTHLHVLICVQITLCPPTLPQLPLYTIDDTQYLLLKTTRSINTHVDLLRNFNTDDIFTLDCEWDVALDRRGAVESSGTVAVIQLGYFDKGVPKARVFQLERRQNPRLPDRLLALFADPRFTFYGRMIDADLIRIGRDWGCTEAMKKVERVDLGRMARERAVANWNASLETLVAVTLKRRLSKAVRIGKWSSRLSTEQVKYAAMDVTVALEVYKHLSELTDLTARLTADEAKLGKRVFIVPKSGSVANMSTRLASGTIVFHKGDWANPFDPHSKGIKEDSDCRLVRIEKIFAPAAKVPGLKVIPPPRPLPPP